MALLGGMHLPRQVLMVFLPVRKVLDRCPSRFDHHPAHLAPTGLGEIRPVLSCTSAPKPAVAHHHTWIICWRRSRSASGRTVGRLILDINVSTLMVLRGVTSMISSAPSSCTFSRWVSRVRRAISVACGSRCQALKFAALTLLPPGREMGRV
jgi:hypothetical protein